MVRSLIALFLTALLTGGHVHIAPAQGKVRGVLCIGE